MKEKALVICDDDAEYVSRLGRYISGKAGDRFMVACFSDREKMREYLIDHEVGLILAGQNWIGSELPVDDRRWILLSDSEPEEERTKDQSGTPECRRIFRYQPADRILAEIMQGMALPGGGRVILNTPASIIGVYGPAGWPEMTRLALALASGLGREGPSVCVGLSEFSPMMGLMGKAKGYDLSDVAYCWKRGKLTYDQLERMAGHEDGFDFIPAPENPAELEELTEQGIGKLLEAILSAGGYQSIVADFGGSISGRISLFTSCSRNFVLFPDTGTGRIQREEFLKFWGNAGGGELLKHTECVMLPLEELRTGRRGKTEEYMDELAERLLRGSPDHGKEGGSLICGGD